MKWSVASPWAVLPTLVLLFVSSSSFDMSAHATPPRAPLTLSLKTPDKVVAGTEITVSVRIDRRRPDALPMDLRLVLPAGVTLVGPKASERIVDSANRTITRTFRLRVAQIPKDDLVVTVDASDAIHGVHARKTFDFGRPPEPTKPPTTLVVRGPSGAVIGRGVLLQPTRRPGPR